MKPRCVCLFYGRGLTQTRVHAPYCPVHGKAPVQPVAEEAGSLKEEEG